MSAPRSCSPLPSLLGGIAATLISTATLASLPPSTPAPANTAVAGSGVPAAWALSPQAGYGRIPLHFEPNLGQANGAVQFLARGPGYGLFLQPDAMTLGLRQGPASRMRDTTHPAATAAAVTHFVRAQLVAADGKAVGVAEAPLTGYSNYLTGTDRTRWHTKVPQFERVRFHEVYPKVDVVYYGNQQQLEYDFVVAPGGDPQRIRLAYAGIDSATVDGQGALHLQVAGAELIEHKPAIYQTRGGSRVPVDGQFSLTRNGDHGVEVAFAVADYDHALPLVIDPALAYSTFLGGAGDETPGGIAIDRNGNAYLSGTTMSLDFPTTPGAPQTTLASKSDIFVTKLSADGKSLVYSTYLGGAEIYLDNTGLETASKIAVDASGAAYVTGTTTSPDFPVTAGAYQASIKGTETSDMFVTKLSADGSSLVYSTYLGGSDADSASGIAVDSNGAAHVIGLTYSTDFPFISGIHKAMPGDYDSVVSKLSADGTRLLHSTYLGGANDTAGAIAVDSTGAVYVTGSATTTFPVTPGAYQTVNAGPHDVFVSKISADGKSYVYSTFLGGSLNDVGFAIDVDSTGAAYVAGTTTSGDFPVTAGAFQTKKKSSSNLTGVFVSKFSADGSSLAYSTFLTGTSLDAANGIAVDSRGRAYVTGSTQSTDFPVTIGAPQNQNAGNADTFVTLLNNAGSGLVYSTLLGGAYTDYGNAIAIDSNGNAYVIGQTESADFPTTAGAYDTTYDVISGTAKDVFAARIVPVTAFPSALDFGDVTLGTSSSPLTLTFRNDGFSAIDLTGISNANSQFHRSTTCGASLDANATCTITVTFAPTDVGAAQDALTVATSVGPALIKLSGSSPGKGARVSPGALVFADQRVGTTSAAQLVSITNYGTVPLTISSVTASAGFSQTNTCLVILPGDSCAVSVRFTPTAMGAAAGTLTIVTDAFRNPAPVTLSGNGVTPLASLAPSSLDFGNRTAGTTSGIKTITLTNAGTAALDISSLSVTGPFAQTNTCGSSVDAGAQCTINVTFTPVSVGGFSGTLTLVSNAASSPDMVTLSGNGTGPQVGLSATSLSFGSLAVGTTSAAKTVTLTNTGTTTLTVSGVTASDGYVQTNNCSSVAVGKTCTINVSFAPTVAGSIKGTLSIATNAYGSPSTVKLTGTAIAAPAVTLSPASVNFGNHALGTTSTAKTVTLTNSGTGTLTLSAISAIAPFAQTSTCGSSLAAGAKCSISVTFKPTLAGASGGSLTITSNAATSPDSVALSGTGTGPQGRPSPTSVAFGNQAVGTTSAGRTVTLTNIGTTTLTISSVAVTTGFTQSNGCSSLAAGKSCSITAKFAPKAKGAATGTLTIKTNAYDSPSKVSLSGTGT